MLRSIARRVKRRLFPAVSMPAGEKPAAFYDALYTSSAVYNAHPAQAHYYFLWCVIADRVRSGRVRSVLEVGCGPGQLAQVVHEMTPSVTYRGFDFSPKAIELATAANPWGNWWVGDARSPDNFSGAYDCAICTEVLEHVEDDLAVMENVPAGARCLCTVPSFPYESHVRTFPDAATALARYARFFSAIPNVVTFRSPRDPNDLFHLIDGFRC